MFPLNMNSRWEFRPGSLADVQDTAARPQPPLLEAEPTERGGRQSSQTRGPSTPQTDPVGTAGCCFGPPLAVHTRGPLSESISCQQNTAVLACRATVPEKGERVGCYRVLPWGCPLLERVWSQHCPNSPFP